MSNEKCIFEKAGNIEGGLAAPREGHYHDGPFLSGTAGPAIF